jgi:predicted phosphodiesterase
VALEVMSVSDDDAVAFDGARRRAWHDLAPDSEVALDGTVVRTLPRPGELLCRFATVNDVHFGETCCGLIEGTDIGPVFRADDGAEPYPEFMNRGAVEEIAAIDPAAVVVKGDLTSSGTTVEYERFLECYRGAFGDRLHHVRGNHDAYHGEVFADWPAQEIELPGVRLALLDTARLRQVNGSLSPDQLDWLDELASRSDRPVLVLGHHHMWSPEGDVRTDDYFGLRPDDAEALLAVFARRPSLVGYFAGHTHRNRRVRIAQAGEVPWVEVGCVKDYPGTWAEYRVFDGGILQVARRVSSPDALAWTEQTRHMFEGGYAAYALGELDDRCFPIWPRTR